MIFFVSACDDYVVDIGEDITPQLAFEHAYEALRVEGCYEACLGLVLFFHVNLVIP